MLVHSYLYIHQVLVISTMLNDQLYILVTLVFQRVTDAFYVSRPALPKENKPNNNIKAD